MSIKKNNPIACGISTKDNNIKPTPKKPSPDDILKGNIEFLKKYDLANELNNILKAFNVLKFQYVLPICEFLNYFSMGTFIIYNYYLAIKNMILFKKMRSKKDQEKIEKTNKEAKNQEIVQKGVKEMYKRNKVQICPFCDPTKPKKEGLIKLTGDDKHRIYAHSSCLPIVEPIQGSEKKTIIYRDKKNRLYFLDKDVIEKIREEAMEKQESQKEPVKNIIKGGSRFAKSGSLEVKDGSNDKSML